MVPPHCVLPWGYSQLSLFFSLLIFATSVTAVEREHANENVRKTLEVRRETVRHGGNFLWVPLHHKSRHEGFRESLPHLSTPDRH